MKAGNRESLLDDLLPVAIKKFGPGFSRFADCGAGVGTVSAHYSALLDTHLAPSDRAVANVACFEPLPENLVELRRVCLNQPNLTVRPAAVSNFNGRASFAVPTRMATLENTQWPPGTSFDGSLGSYNTESVEVDVVRLDADPPYDFIKLDLQGGEINALEGLGEKIKDVKMIYSEYQLLTKANTVEYLRSRGFICFFDRLQFGFRPDIAWIALEVLEQWGLKISHINLPATLGIPFFCIGYFDMHADPVQHNGCLSDEMIKQIDEIGLSYLQTDILAINSKFAGELVNYL